MLAFLIRWYCLLDYFERGVFWMFVDELLIVGLMVFGWVLGCFIDICLCFGSCLIRC